MKKIVYVGMIVMAISLPVLVFALPTPTVIVGPNDGGWTLETIKGYLNTIASFLITVSVVIAVIMIIWGGILWMTAGGNDDRIKTARTTVWRGVIGAAIVLAVGVILQTVANVVLGRWVG